MRCIEAYLHGKVQCPTTNQSATFTPLKDAVNRSDSGCCFFDFAR